MVNHSLADLQSVVITMKVAEHRVLFILLSKDGSVNRMGGGAVETADGALFIGIDPSLFSAALEHLSQEVIDLAGLYDVPEKVGMHCVLTIDYLFNDSSGRELEIRYGSESMGPPQEVARFVHGAVWATQRWYQEQRRRAGKAPALTPEELPPCQSPCPGGGSGSALLESASRMHRSGGCGRG